ncbi:a-pheromone receptor PreA [Cordyceps militaris CM01]|uniref:A-pheromone receptor PreA n=1 Tax=Cordyceps militaris (strain CM01) TaxID=983644 RepID=G3J5D1_CORMM|nr:a-pheromone receptor PreA [Cordyceps militaris CM01]EGX96841.1 a-pheromone receptor PreA [Cordyceps militaris CM01]
MAFLRPVPRRGASHLLLLLLASGVVVPLLPKAGFFCRHLNATARDIDISTHNHTMELHSLMGREAASPIFAIGPSDPPYTSPSLTANLVARVVLGVVANLVCLVPLRLLYRNGEFAAAVFIVVVEVKNVFTILMALLWQTDDLASWWPGYGLCDIEPFVYNGCAGIFVTCLLAIMRNLAHQVGVLRANPMTVREKRRRNLIQALIIFPLPILQMALTWPLAARRYAVGTLMGCSWVPSSTWPFLVFFVIAQLVVSVVAAIYAVMTFFRFREVTKTTSSALSSNRAAFLRSQRAKRRLYLMVMSILVPFLPITITLCVLNVHTIGLLQPFNFNKIHHSNPGGIPWGAIIYVPSRLNSFGSLNNGYISILTAIPIFLFFGMTKDAINSYRMVLLYIGLGKVWPDLRNEYDPDRKAMQTTTSSGYLTRISGLTNQTTCKSTASGESLIGSSLSRLVTPRLAESLGGGPHDDTALRPPPPSWTSLLPQNLFPFRSKTSGVNVASAIRPQAPVLPPLGTEASTFSLQSQNEDEIVPQPVCPQCQHCAMSPPRTRNFSLPVLPAGQSHPSEALDLPNDLSTLESSSRSVKFANRT